MRVDANMFNNQIIGAKSELANSERSSESKADIVKQSNQKEENVSLPGERKLIEAVEKANKEMVGTNTHVKFSVHEKTKKLLIKIVDNETEEVVKEIPSEKILNMITEMCEKAGIFIDKRG